MAFSDAAAVAQQLVDALAAARRMGFAPVVGLLTTDQVADLNDDAAAANLLLDGRTDDTAEVIQEFQPMTTDEQNPAPAWTSAAARRHPARRPSGTGAGLAIPTVGNHDAGRGSGGLFHPERDQGQGGVGPAHSRVVRAPVPAYAPLPSVPKGRTAAAANTSALLVRGSGRRRMPASPFAIFEASVHGEAHDGFGPGGVFFLCLYLFAPAVPDEGRGPPCAPSPASSTQGALSLAGWFLAASSALTSLTRRWALLAPPCVRRGCRNRPARPTGSDGAAPS